MSHYNFISLIILGALLLSCEKNENDIFLSDEPVNIPDKEFQRRLMWIGVDTNGDSIITYREAAAIEILNLSSYFCPDITDLTGIEAFTNLSTLVCRCNKIDTMDLSMNTSLREVYAYDNDLRSIDVSGCKELYYLHIGTDGLCSKNRLSSLDISNCKLLRTLICGNNLLKELDISNNPDLENLICPLNQLTSIDLSKNTKLNELEIWSNQLSSIELSNCTSLSILDFSVNQIVDVSLECSRNLVKLDASRNPLKRLNVSQNRSLKLLVIKDMPDLELVCGWASTFPPQDLIIVSSEDSKISYASSCE